MRFTSAIVQTVLSASTLAAVLPSEGPAARRAAQLAKRADFDPVKACYDWRPREKEWAVISTSSHNVIFDPSIGNFDSEVTDGLAILVDHSCTVLDAQPYEARGSGNGFEVWFEDIQGYTVRARVATMGVTFGIADAEIQTDGVDVEVECSGQRDNIEGLDVDSWNSCSFA